MTLPTKIDLRSNYDRVYNQGYQGSCGPHALTACLDILYERATGKPHRFNKQSIYHNCHEFMGVWGDQYGVNGPSIQYVASNKGFICDEPSYNNQYIKGFKIEKVSLRGVGWNSWKELLARGIPIYVAIRAGSVFMNKDQSTLPWYEHRWGNDINKILDFQYQHAVALVGYDDERGCWLFENSWGAEWGDGGFFGIPYDQMHSFLEESYYFSMLPVKTHNVEGFIMQVTNLFSSEASAFVEKSKSALLAMLMKELQDNEVQGLLNLCKNFGISDKHLEMLTGWPRGLVKNYKVDHPELNWDGFHWEQ